jgi:aerobic carbon-monoxide dehydrogenase small subunit
MGAAVKELDIAVEVNGHNYEATVEVRRTLADFLREDLGLTGTHLGCEHGACGACTVLVENQPVRSCLMLAVQGDGTRVVTVEGLAANGMLHPLQHSFKQHHGLQCGFCTPGFLMTALALLRENNDPSEPEVREYISGNICRCTGYQFIVDAILAAARVLREQASQQSGP